ncbi:FkbM family methyltransferase [Fodinicola acaciae]|uniref:FkbM family methyltransferase n=1 Tax=Fodinicola acaciae TaxID=2681555 RepID=UPI0013D10EB4|nr:FkbM family methyltransferase [Fodinicola acaciae]
MTATKTISPPVGVHVPAGKRIAAIVAGLRTSAALSPFTEKEVLGLPALIPSGGVCFDIGAAYGMYTFPLAQLVGGSGQVHSFEPLAGSARLLDAARLLGGGRNVRLHREAVGREPGRQVITVPTRWGLPIRGRAFLSHGASDTGANDEFSSHRDVTISVTTVDQVCRTENISRVDFMKIDVEGAEMAVLEGAAATIESHLPHLLLEVEDRHLRKYGLRCTDVVDCLATRGYRMYGWNGRRWVPSSRVTTAARNYLFSVSLDRQPAPAGAN